MKQVQIPSGASLAALYRELMGDYPKFFKMDTLSKLGVLLAELLCREEPERFQPRRDRAVLVFSREGCRVADTHYAESMASFPSPALFVYTLPNIVTGEIAIRNKWAGETSAFIIDSFDKARMTQLIQEAFLDRETQQAFVAWIDCRSDQDWTAEAWLIDKNELWTL